MRFNLRQLFFLTLICSVLLCAGLSLRSALATRIVASVDHSNGTRLRVVQKFEYSGDLFNTSIYFDNGDGQWRWYYFDHDDSYWGRAKSEVTENTVRIESNNRKIQFDTVTGECKISNQEVGDRIYANSTRIVRLPDGIAD